MDWKRVRKHRGGCVCDVIDLVCNSSIVLQDVVVRDTLGESNPFGDR